VAVVYLLRNGGEDLYKVGWATNVAERLKDHHTSNPRLARVWVVEIEDRAAATHCEAYLKGILQSRRHPGSDEFFALTADEAEGAEAELRRYLAEDVPRQRDVEALSLEDDGTVVKPGDAEWEAWRRLMVAREAECRASAEKNRLENRLKLRMGTAAELEGVATWRTHVTTRLDEAALQAAKPEVWRAFRRESKVRRFLPQ
jgi:predicted GIY-YIG superfamily endonuclease